MIYVEDEVIKVNGVVLPGLLKSIEIKETAKIDEQEVKGSATKPKQATGYEDAKITIELILDDTATQTKYERLGALREVFRAPGQTIPQPISIVSEDTSVHNISTVLFKGLTHKAENKKEQLPVTLEFWEYIPQTITATKSSSQSAKNSKGSQSSSQNGLSESYQNYLSKNRGKSPAIDNASATNALNRTNQMPY